MTKTFLTLGILLAAGAAQAQLPEAIKLTDKEQFEKATAAFTRIVAAEPSNGEAWFYLGENHFANDRTDSAEACYRKGIEVNPRFPLNYAGLGKVLHARGKAAEATEQFNAATNAALDKASKFGKPLIAATYREEAEGLLEGANKEYAAAIALIDKAIALNPKDAELYILKGDALFDQNPRDGSTPLENYKKAMEVDALNAKPQARKGFMYYRAKNFPAAIEEYTKAIAIDPAFAPAYSGRAEAYYMARDFDKATADMDKYLELNSGSQSARVRNAQFLFLVKKYDESLREIDALEAQGVKNTTLKRIKAYDLVEQGDTTRAIPAFEAYFAEQSQEKVIGSDLEYYGKALLLMHQDSLAGEKMLEAVQLDKTKDYLYLDAAKAFTSARAYDKAITAMKAKIADGRPEVNDWYYLGSMANRAKNFTLADSAWAEYIAKQPNIYQGYLYRARAQAGMDTAEVKTWSARPYYEDVIRKMKPEEQERAKADLEEAYNYMGLYYLYDKEAMDRAKAKCFFEKVADLGANTSITKQVNDVFLKMKELKDVTPGTCDVL